ncbi:hypothetical protein PoB_002450800 [Plakobranchus ocellatus]|uniref:Uncharacterized protein n=1 Tax=Plakobranchus ocellatus TaxID=259542 RepID=A0AAV3ZUA0_9GAST|nr:hypothetical protein PoB_002450800 [Plakobranchus ocellatus]
MEIPRFLVIYGSACWNVCVSPPKRSLFAANEEYVVSVILCFLGIFSRPNNSMESSTFPEWSPVLDEEKKEQEQEV